MGLIATIIIVFLGGLTIGYIIGYIVGADK